jgi:hypothetical protein
MSANDVEPRASVAQLTQYWRDIEALSPGQSLEYIIPSYRFPPWTEICSELSWEVHLVDRKYFSRKRWGYKGVYRLIGLADKGDTSKPATLNRVCGQDTTGTLYIGEAKTLNARLNQLQRTALRRQRSHGAIRMLRHTPLGKVFPEDQLAIALLFTDLTPKFVEGHLLEAYMSSFGDTPPLNYRL